MFFNFKSWLGSSCQLLPLAQLVSKQLVGMLIVIIVKTSLKDCFGEVKTSAAGAGILGVMVCDVLFCSFVLDLSLTTILCRGTKEELPCS